MLSQAQIEYLDKTIEKKIKKLERKEIENNQTSNPHLNTTNFRIKALEQLRTFLKNHDSTKKKMEAENVFVSMKQEINRLQNLAGVRGLLDSYTIPK